MSVENVGASAHRKEAITNSSTEVVNSRTCPKRRVSQPVSGSEMALATPKEVITQVPWSGETPRSPAIAGIDTLAMDVSRTFMNVASDSAIVPTTRAAPLSGGAAGAAPAAPPVTGLSAFSFAMSVLPARWWLLQRRRGPDGRLRIGREQCRGGRASAHRHVRSRRSRSPQ